MTPVDAARAAVDAARSVRQAAEQLRHDLDLTDDAGDAGNFERQRWVAAGRSHREARCATDHCWSQLLDAAWGTPARAEAQECVERCLETEHIAAVEEARAYLALEQSGVRRARLALKTAIARQQVVMARRAELQAETALAARVMEARRARAASVGTIATRSPTAKAELD